MAKVAFFILLLATSYALKAQSVNETAIRQVLAPQTKAWNEGNINDYMKGYWNSDSLVFIGKNGPRYGYASTLANYKKSYPDTASMGKLNFEILQVKELSSLYYFVIGKWYLQRSVGDINGSFTLLFKKFESKWYIVADHSS